MTSDGLPVEELRIRADLKNLLGFSEQLLAAREKVVFDVAEYPIHLNERDLLGTDGVPLPGIAFGPAEDVWLSFARLHERRPPTPGAELQAWLRPEAHPTPSSPPMPAVEQVVQVSAEEATDLIEAGLVEIDAVSLIDGRPSEVERWAVPLRPAELPEISDALAAYTGGPWRAWAIEEAPRREAIKRYEALFRAQAQIAATGGEGGLELVVGIGLARWQHGGRRVNVPLIEQRAEFELDEANGTLSILPRNVPPVPVLAAFLELAVPGTVELLREMTVRLDGIARDPDVLFSPFHPTSFRGVLETCAARLDASGTVLAAEDEERTGAELRISPTFCVIVRVRRDDILRDDVRRLAEVLIQDHVPLPETARRFVVPPSDDVHPTDSGMDGDAGSESTNLGWTGGGWTSESEKSRCGPRDWLFFPLPANEEQEEIARRLEQKDVHGVVVQGPPGTGKTHTIANIIGHWMALGRRVLVAAHTAEALTAIRDKLPAQLRDLAIAVTHSDREGARQLEQAVSALADRVQSINQGETKRRTEDLLRAITQMDTRVSELDVELAAIARANLTEMPWRGGSALPQAIAAWVAAQGGQHAWFPDALDLIPEHKPRFGEPQVAEARTLRRRLGEDLSYRPDDLPSGAEALPSIGSIVSAHRALRKAEERAKNARDGSLPRPDLSVAGASELAHLLDWLERLALWRDTCANHPWMPATWEALASGRPRGPLGTEGLRSLLEEAALLTERGEALALHALELPEIAENDRLGEALARLAAGRRPFGPLGAFGRSRPVKGALDGARIAGEPPRDAIGWAKLEELHAWRRDVRGFAARWNAFAEQNGLTRLSGDHAAARDALGRLGKPAFEMLTLVAHAQTSLEQLRMLFPYGLDVESVVLRIDVSVAVASLRANMGHAELIEAERLRDAVRDDGRRVGGMLGEALQEVAEGLGSPDIGDAELDTQWRKIQIEANRLAALRGDMRRLSALADLIRESGAAQWATNIETELPDFDDSVLPVAWEDAWDYARAIGFLSRVANRVVVQQLAHTRAELIAVRERRFLEVIELLTYLGLRSRLTENVQAALRQFLAALARLPKTPGAKTAVRQRRILRQSLQRAVKAIPCWIMPEWRVAEQLPAELGSFDLVIIDEASQSNILALPVVLRGKKLLIVGDDRQVSPVSWEEEATVNRLRAIYLTGQPLAEQIDPATSLYELGGMMYPGRVIVLREHFRCVEPIIRFSSRFYGGHLVPLRLPKPSERLDPPLVDIFVEDGRRRGDVNKAEAGIIIEEIQKIIADPVLNASGKRTIGVISLHAATQAKLIYDLLIQAVGPEGMSDHQIKCGDAATFQGQERDIVFLSMVHDESTASKQSSRLYEQRYNVALSRARDRMVLVRSVSPSMLKEGDIKLDVLRHFQDPMAGSQVEQAFDVLARCESDFEREVGKRLLTSGYRLRAQVPAGGYRIDFVVEGADDHRLAVELDGDSFHGPDRWVQDVRRQKALERVGWIFWRCWASEWETDKDRVFSDLVACLDRNGIGPIGALSPGDMPSVEFRTVRYSANSRRSQNETGNQTAFYDVLTGEPKSIEPVAGISSSSPQSAKSDDLLEAKGSHVEIATAAPELLASTTVAVTVPDPSTNGAARKVAVGDTVVVRYADGNPRSLTVRIVSDGSADGRSRITPTAPLAAAILGLRTEDEADMIVDGRACTVIVEDIRESN